MKYTIECSFGEIVDKITILEIKLSKSPPGGSQYNNILKEHSALSECIHMKNPELESLYTSLYNELSTINTKLWNLEDIIREKSRTKSFDSTYLYLAESIHKTNDDRFRVKQQLNQMVDSDILEYKFYSDTQTNPEVTTQEFQTIGSIPQQDIDSYQQVKTLFNDGEFISSEMILKILCEKYAKYNINHFSAELYFSYNMASRRVGLPNIYKDKIETIAANFSHYIVDPDTLNQAKKLYGIMLLEEKEYVKSWDYIRYLQPANNGTLIQPETMSYFKPGDKNKTLLIYTAGGIGDKMMHTRFIRHIYEKEIKNKNKIILMVDRNLYWIYSQLYTYIHNIHVQVFSNVVPYFDYHININALFVSLKLEYKDIFMDPFLKSVTSAPFSIMESIISKKQYNFIINWRGNANNTDEKHNRGIALDHFVPLFEKYTNINWISVQKDVTNKESAILRQFKIKNIGNILDTKGDAFSETLSIMREVDLVISSDTALVHIAGSADIPCWCMLSIACDWRWTSEGAFSNWYPKVNLIRQKKSKDWSQVVEDVIENINEVYFEQNSHQMRHELSV